jgi:hypothetical protein
MFRVTPHSAIDPSLRTIKRAATAPASRSREPVIDGRSSS